MPTATTDDSREARRPTRSSSSAPTPTRSRATPRFEALDIDSLDLVELAQIVEDEYGVELTTRGPEDDQDRRRRGRPDRGARRVSRRVAITGVGAVTPLGVGADALHERWSAGECGIADGAARCRDFDADRAPRPPRRRAARTASRSSRSSPPTRRSADAGWDDGAPLRRRADRLRHRHRHRRHRHARGPARRARASAGRAGLAARRPADDGQRRRRRRRDAPRPARARATGRSRPAPPAPTRSAAALRMIQSGDADAVVTGGAEAALTPLASAAFAALDALSPTGISRPFDARRDGFVMGEGAGVLVLEDGRGRAARGARVLGDAARLRRDLRRPPPDRPRAAGEGAARAIAAALARRRPRRRSDVDYVNAHGTSTPLNDRAETRALKAALGERAHAIPVSSTKSAIGHLLGAAGAVEAVATILALRERVAPPTLGSRSPRRARPRLRAGRGRGRWRANGTRAGRALELVRLRRPQRRALPGGGRDAAR